MVHTLHITHNASIHFVLKKEKLIQQESHISVIDNNVKKY